MGLLKRLNKLLFLKPASRIVHAQDCKGFYYAVRFYAGETKLPFDMAPTLSQQVKEKRAESLQIGSLVHIPWKTAVDACGAAMFVTPEGVYQIVRFARGNVQEAQQ